MQLRDLPVDKDVLVLVLAVLELGTLVALALVVRAWRRERATSFRATTELATIRNGLPSARQAAGWAVRTAVETAGRVRERGFVEGMLLAPIEDLTGLALQDQAEIRKVAAPDGTVTFLFSDIEDSTSLNDRLGDEAWVRVLQAHDRVVRAAVTRCDGHVVKSQGDGFMIVFGSPTEAVSAACAIQRDMASGRRRLRRTPVRVRIGIHVGTAVSRDGDYFGRHVAKAARVASLAEGGQVLVSDQVREGLEDGVALESVGEVELKGLTGSHRLWSVTG